MLSMYPACFIKEEDGYNGYSVVFPDLNNLATCGKDENEAMAMAIDCLAGYIWWLKNDGDPIPSPSSIKDISIEKVMEELEGDPNDEGYVTMVSVDVEEYASLHFEKSVKKTLTIPAWLNIAAQKKNINFSQVLKEALIAKVRN